MSFWDFQDAVDAEADRRERIAGFRRLIAVIDRTLAETGRQPLDSLPEAARFYLAHYQDTLRRYRDFVASVATSLEDGDGQRSPPRDGHY